MSRAETSLRASGEHANLSVFDKRVIEVMRASRAAQEERAKFHARNAVAVHERDDFSVTYQSLACEEAEALAKRILRIDRQRLLPIPKPIRVTRERDWHVETYNGQKTHVITTPILFSHDPVYVVDTGVSDFPAELSSGWKFTTISKGNDLRHAIACASTPNPGDTPARRVTRLKAEHVVYDPSTGTERIFEANHYNLHNSKVRTFPIGEKVDPDSERFVIQTGILRAARLACGEEIPEASALDINI